MNRTSGRKCCNCCGKSRSIYRYCGFRKICRGFGSCYPSNVLCSLFGCLWTNCVTTRARMWRSCRARKSSTSPLRNRRRHCPSMRTNRNVRCCSMMSRGMRMMSTAMRSGCNRTGCRDSNWVCKSSWDSRDANGHAIPDATNPDTIPSSGPIPNSIPS